MPQPLSSVDICNLALASIAVKPISTLGDPIEAARGCKRWYDFQRRDLLESSDWSFARKAAKLNLISAAAGLSDFPDWAQAGLSGSGPAANLVASDWVFPWAYLYAYPPSCLFIHKVYNAHAPSSAEEWCGYDQSIRFATWVERNRSGWEIMRSRKSNQISVATNLQSALVKFTEDITDTSQFDNCFVDALQLKIAAKLVVPLTGDMELKQQIDKDLVEAMSNAYRQNFSEAPEYGPRSSAYEDVRGM